jgi:O-antigen ligase
MRLTLGNALTLTFTLVFRFASWWASVGVVAVMLGVPLGSHLGFGIGAHDASRLAQLVVLAFCSACLLISACLQSFKWGAFDCTTAVAAGMVVFLMLMAVGMAPDRVHALRELCLLLGLFAAAACVASLRFDRQVVALLSAIALGAAMYATVVFGIAVWVTASGLPLLHAEMFFGYDSYRFYNHVQTVTLPLLAVAACTPGVDRRLRTVAIYGFALGFALLLLSAGRATMLSLLVAFTATVLIFRGHARRFVAVIARGAAIGGMAFALLAWALPWWMGMSPATGGIGFPSDMSSDHSRFYLWKLAIAYIEESPWFGIGPMHYANRINPKAAHPHNVYLQIAAEWGVPILLLLVGFAVAAFRRLHRSVLTSQDRVDKTVGIGLFAAWVAVAVDAMFSGNFVMPLSQMWIAFLVGCTIAWRRSTVEPNEVHVRLGTRAKSRLAYGVLPTLTILISQGWLVANVRTEASDLAAHLEYVRRDLAPNTRTNPRFWSHGWF